MIELPSTWPGLMATADLESQEPLCPECKAEILYECVACGRNNYPPQRTWVGLTDDEFNELYDSYVPTACYALLIEEVEAKLKEKNT